jgi:simple sugar transport system ATP-binding protein
MGENGAGKSTLIKVINGVYRADGGALLLDGQPVLPASPLHAERLGIRTVHQEVNLVPQRSVMENLSLGHMPTRLGLIRWGEVKRRAVAALARLGVDIDVTRPLEQYSAAIRQLVAIARAIGAPDRAGAPTKVLILDEPTSSLDGREVARLFAILNQLKSQQGLSIVFVSHFLDEVYQISDRITVLRNGKLVGEWQTPKLPRLELVAAMLGKELVSASHDVEASKAATPAAAAGGTRPAVRVLGLAKKGLIEPVQFDIPSGQTVGLAGLLGSGRSETARLCFGADVADKGRMEVTGRTVAPPRSPRQAMRFGIAMTSEDRKADGIFPNLSVRENIAIALQCKTGVFRMLSRRRQQQLAEEFRTSLGIKTPHLEQPIRLLSGGNQQKCLIARWLATAPMLLILDEPTRGIDVGAKADVERLVRGLCDGGASVLFISSELKEVVDVSDHVVVLRDRRQIAVLGGDDISEANVMRLISGGEAGPRGDGGGDAAAGGGGAAPGAGGAASAEEPAHV